jgi:hypothetical protein
MGNKVEMCKLNTLYNLHEEKPRLVFSKFMLVDVLKQLATRCHLHDHKNIGGSIQYFVEFDDVGVFDELEYFDLAFHLLREEGTLDIIFLFFIRALLMILTATRWPVRVCNPSESDRKYHAPWHNPHDQSCGPECNGR